MTRKFTIGFFAALLLLTWFSWKLYGFRTPQVLCISPNYGQLPDEDGILQSYACILPLDAIQGEGDDRYVYLVEETSSFFYPVVARKVWVTIQEQTKSQAAVTGLASNECQVVLYASRLITGDTIPVLLWEVGE